MASQSGFGEESEEQGECGLTRMHLPHSRIPSGDADEEFKGSRGAVPLQSPGKGKREKLREAERARDSEDMYYILVCKIHFYH